MGVSENVVYPIAPNGFADHYPYEKWLAIIRKINPTFSGPNPYPTSPKTGPTLQKPTTSPSPELQLLGPQKMP